MNISLALLAKQYLFCMNSNARKGMLSCTPAILDMQLHPSCSRPRKHHTTVQPYYGTTKPMAVSHCRSSWALTSCCATIWTRDTTGTPLRRGGVGIAKDRKTG